MINQPTPRREVIPDTTHRSLLPASAERQQLADPRLELIHNDPAGVGRYAGGPSLPNAAVTVFLEQPIEPPISEIDTPSDRRSRRISARSSTINTCFLPALTAARVTGKLGNFSCRTVVSIQLPSTV
jgi:hypothetical protein